ncbi:hypothetical protein DL96DRAFT_1704587 [Flagelloscypha sp. PMI_526]|nr:hypothetical protein DL96DRAFT_1704587 [Flagelloscypha sp. PMI_526]
MSPIPGIGEKTGPQLFGFLLNWMLQGALFVQVYHYHVSFPRDALHAKIIVYTIFTLECIQTALMGYSAYAILGKGWGDPEALEDIQIDWISVCLLGAIIPGIVQGFYAWRIRKISGSLLAGGIIGFLAFTQTVCGIIQGAFSKLTAVNSKLTSSPTVVIIWMVSGALCDVLIVVFMTYFLRMNAKAILSPKINDALTRIVRYTIETGLVTAVCAIVLLGLFLGLPTKAAYAVPNRPLAKLYSVNLMVLLNARSIVIGGRNDSGARREVVTTTVNEIRFGNSGTVSVEPIHLQTKVPLRNRDSSNNFGESETEGTQLSEGTKISSVGGA